MIKTLKYSTANIQMLFDNLVNLFNQGLPIDFEIRIDDLIVIPRTNDVGKFFSFKKTLTQFSHEVCFVLFKGKSRRNDKYILVRNGNISPDPNMTAQEYIDSEVAKALKIEAKQIEFARLMEKTANQKNMIKQFQKRIAELEAKNKGDIKELMQLVSTYLPNQKKPEKQSESINGIPVNDIVLMIAQARNKYGDEIFGEAIGIAMKVADHPKIIADVKTYINQKIQENEKQ